MMRSVISLMVVGLGLSAVASNASADASVIATSMGDLRWGMSEYEVQSFAKRQLSEHYGAEAAKTKDAGKQSKLKSDLKAAQGAVDKGITNFEGGKSRWDNSPVAGEFQYDNSESMLFAKDVSADDYYFFVDGKLWKHVQVLDKSAAGGGDFKKFSSVVEGKFGKGRVKKGELTPGQGNTQWLEYLDRNSRLRAGDSTPKRSFTLVYEEMATVRQLASTRPKAPTRLAGQSDEDEVAAKPASPSKEEIAKAQTKRSVFQSDNKQETESDFQTRKQKAANEAKERAQRAQTRKEEAKKGEVLKQLDSVNDSDPLGGL